MNVPVVNLRWQPERLALYGMLVAPLRTTTAVLIQFKLPSLDMFHPWLVYYSDVIISAMTSQIVGVASVCSSACSGAHKKNTSKLRVTEGYLPVTGEFSALRASNAKNVFIWWRNHVRWKNYINITSLFNDMFLNMIFIFANNRLSIFNDYLIHIDGAYTKIYWDITLWFNIWFVFALIWLIILRLASILIHI